MDKNLTEWKKPYLMNDREADSEGDEDEENDSMEEGERDEENGEDDDTEGDDETEPDDEDETPRLSKYSTMKETAEVRAMWYSLDS